jgi:hypothetical protein
MPRINTIACHDNSATSQSLPELAERINAYHEQTERFFKSCKESFGNVLEFASKAGALLNEAKRLVPHGEWLPWLETNCRVGERQARKYIALAKADREMIAMAVHQKMTMNQVMARISETKKLTKTKESQSKSAPGTDLDHSIANQNALPISPIADDVPTYIRDDPDAYIANVALWTKSAGKKIQRYRHALSDDPSLIKREPFRYGVYCICSETLASLKFWAEQSNDLDRLQVAMLLNLQLNHAKQALNELGPPQK